MGQPSTLTYTALCSVLCSRQSSLCPDLTSIVPSSYPYPYRGSLQIVLKPTTLLHHSDTNPLKANPTLLTPNY